MLWLGPALPAAAAELFAEGLASGSGSTVGPDGALYMTEGAIGRVSRIDLATGEVSTFASDLPPWVIGVGGAIAFGNSVPTGLTVRGRNVYMAQAGPAPHAPGDGRIVTFDHVSAGSAAVASGAPLMVDVQFGRGGQLYGLAQGLWNGAFPGSPPFGETGELVRVNDDGTVTLLAAQLDIPTSMQLIGNDAYVVTLEGRVWKIEELSEPPFGY